ncbi:Lrp/AsnC family transcriptional regulator [Candidatus Woesearchaeota archaeon]|nr:Lrp/AsnC family transcriptional regulator [Candidatus Woesearchaeota archaeon]
MEGIKKRDLLILCELRKNCRSSLTDIGRATKTPVSTVYDKLVSFRGKIIRKYSALMDFAELGFAVKANVIFGVDRSTKEEFSAYLEKHHSVNSLYRINNGYDFMAEIICRDISGFENFMDLLSSKFRIRDKKAFFIIGDIKREEFLADKDMIDALK